MGLRSVLRKRQGRRGLPAWGGPSTLAKRVLCGPWAVQHGDRPHGSQSIRSAVNPQPESRVREIRTHGSEGGGAGISTGPSYPIPTP